MKDATKERAQSMSGHGAQGIWLLWLDLSPPCHRIHGTAVSMVATCPKNHQFRKFYNGIYSLVFGIKIKI